jgi:hypothetical protein
MKRTLIGRRALLRGSSAAIGLPELEAMLDGRGRIFDGRAFAAPPRRLFTFFFPNGVIPSIWMPSTVGTGYTMMPAFAPLEAVRPDINIVSGLNVTDPRTSSGGHYLGTAGFSTGAGVSRSGALGPSIDQVLGAQFGKQSRFQTLVVAVNPGGQPDHLVNNEITSRMFDTISWAGPAQPVPADRDPLALFTRLFGSVAPSSGAPSPDTMRRAAYDKSVLDVVKADMADLTARLGASDRRRLDAHLTSIRELEQRVLNQAPPSAACQPPAAPPDMKAAWDYGGKTKDKATILVDLFVLAVRCDFSRFGSFMLCEGSGSDSGLASGGYVGAPQGQHQYCHAADGPGIAKFTAFHMGWVVQMIKGLKSSPEADGSILDSSLVYIGSELGDGSAHKTVNMPVVIAGKLGGMVKTGRHLQYMGRQLADLHLALLNLCGATQSSFGTSTGPLPGLTT